VLYNKFDVSSSSPPDNPPQQPNSGYNCVVATTGPWRVAQYNEQHLVVCQSDYYIPPGAHKWNLAILSFFIDIKFFAIYVI